MKVRADWSKRAGYIRSRHAVEPTWADEAVGDEHAGTMSKIDDLLAEEGAAAENYETPEQLPGHIQVSRPNLGRGTVVSVRLSAQEHGHLQRAAEEANLPLSTLIRVWAIDRLRAERDGVSGTVAERLAKLEREVFNRTA